MALASRHCNSTCTQSRSIRPVGTPSVRQPQQQQRSVSAHAHALSAAHPGSRSLGHWQQLRSLASAQTLQCPEAQCAQQQLAATVVAPGQTATGTQVETANNAGLVRSCVVKNRRGYWRIRHFQPTDLHAVADLQAAAFHEALPVGALDRLAYTMFKAEVLDALKKKVEVLCEHSFAMMVVENCQVGPGGNCSAADASTLDSFSDDAGSSSDCNEECSEDWESAVWYGDQQAAAWPGSAAGAAAAAAGAGSLRSADSSSRPGSVLGVVEVGVQDEADVLQHLKRGQLPANGTCAYITSMAVAPHLRRCGVGRALLQAAEQQAANWDQELVALHVYENNAPAIRLYERHGMRCCAQDPAWKGMLGGKVRQLMIKPVSARQGSSS